MKHSRWFLSATVASFLLASSSAHADLVLAIAGADITTGGTALAASNGLPVTGSWSYYPGPPVVVPPTPLFAPNYPGTPISGSVSFGASESVSSSLISMDTNLQLSQSGGPSTNTNGIAGTVLAHATEVAQITPILPDETQYFYVSYQGEIKGYVAPGDSIAYQLYGSGALSVLNNYASGVITSPGSFDISVESPPTLFAYECGNVIYNPEGVIIYPPSIDVSITMQATFTKESAGSSYINFDPEASFVVSNSAIPEPSSLVPFAMGIIAVVGGLSRSVSNRVRESHLSFQAILPASVPQ
jgi:hypothetical protein